MSAMTTPFAQTVLGHTNRTPVFECGTANDPRAARPRVALMPDNDFRVVDGDDLVFGGQRYRLAGYDAPEISNFRSRIDKHLERRRGYQVLLRLKALIAGARCVHLINITIKPIFPNRQHGALEA